MVARMRWRSNERLVELVAVAQPRTRCGESGGAASRGVAAEPLPGTKSLDFEEIFLRF
jgi:hypothetical protein